MSTPLSPPITYQEALAAASAKVAAQQASRAVPRDVVAVTAAASENTIAVRERAAEYAKQAISQLWAQVNPYNPDEVSEFSAKAGRVMGAAQSAAARAAASAQVRQLSAMGVKASTLAQPSPVDVRAAKATVVGGKILPDRRASKVTYGGSDVATVSAEEMSTGAIFARAAATYRWVQSRGGTDAAEQSAQRIDSLIDDNLMLAQRLAEQGVLVKTTVDLDRRPPSKRKKTRIIGYRRVIHPELSRSGTCGMCIAASDRLYKVGELLPIHAHCKCTIAAVTEDQDPADDLNAVDLNQLYKQAGGTSVAHLKRTRYKVDEHGELGPVLVPDKPYKPRTTKSKVRAGNTAVDPKATPESKPDVAARHLPLLEKSLADLRSRGLAEDSPQVTFHKDTIERLRADLQASDGGSHAGRSTTKTPATRGGSRLVPEPARGTGGPPTPPPADSAAASGQDDDPNERLNRLFSEQTPTPQQRSALQRWQGKDRFYEQVQRAARNDPDASDEALQVMSDLQNLAQPLPEDVVVWRGIRSVRESFRADIGDLAARDDEIVQRFMATSVSEQVARDEFTQPGKDAAVLRVTARAGAHAIWVSPIGDSDMAYQGELLFLSGAKLRTVAVNVSGDLPVIEVEVSRP